MNSESFAGHTDLDAFVLEVIRDVPIGFVQKMHQRHQSQGGDWSGSYGFFGLIVLYGMIKHFGVSSVIECSPAYGWTTALIQEALGSGGQHISFEVEDRKQEIVDHTQAVTNIHNWRFVLGDFRQTAHQHADAIAEADLVFIDSDHTADFARWYLEDFDVPNRIKPGALLTIHDIFPLGREWAGFTESPVVARWLQEDGRRHFDSLYINNFRDIPGLDALVPDWAMRHNGALLPNPALWLYKRV